MEETPITTTEEFVLVARNYRNLVCRLIVEKHGDAVSCMRYATFTIVITIIAFLLGLIFTCSIKTPLIAIYLLGLGSLVALLGGIICMVASSKSASKADYYRDELIVLNNLYMSIDLSERIDDKNIKTIVEKKVDGNESVTTVITHKAKQQEQIIQKLLDRS